MGWWPWRRRGRTTSARSLQFDDSRDAGTGIAVFHPLFASVLPGPVGTFFALGARADRALPRMHGLLGRRAPGPDEGMLITPAPSVMTFFMRFPIDVVFLDRSRRIVKIVHSLRPWRTAGARKAMAALELPAGSAARLGLELGMALVLTDAPR
jgi:uncharacterized protein